MAGVAHAEVLFGAGERIQPKILTVVTVGNPQEFGKPLATLGLPVASIDLTIPEPVDAKKPDEASKADAASLARGKKLLERIQQAVGGADKLAAVQDVT